METTEKIFSADSQPQVASLPGNHLSSSSSLKPKEPDSPGAQPLSDKSVPSSAPLPNHGILKGTGPVLGPSSGRRQRPEVTYNLKELSHKTRLPSKSPSATPTQNLPQQLDFTSDSRRLVDLDNLRSATTPNGLGQQTSDEQQPAKRQRINDGINPPNNSLGLMSLRDTGVRPESSGPTSVMINQELVKSVWTILLDGGISDPGELLSLPFFKPFLCHQKKRDIQWNPATTCGRWSFRTKIDLVALLVQITGDHSPTCCSRCDPEMGLFKGCIVTTSETLAPNYYGCANCLYHGRQTFCTLKKINQQKSTAEHVHEQASLKGDTRVSGQQAEASRVRITDTQAGKKRSNPDIIRNWNAFPESNGINPAELSSSSTTAKRRKESVSEPSEILTMERWERAPGRIRSQVTATPES